MATADRTIDSEQLPRGLTVGPQLHRRPDGAPPKSKLGVVFKVRDERFPNGPPLNRVIRLLKTAQPATDWLQPLQQQAIRLLGCSLPYVCTLREAAPLPAGGLYLIEDYAPDCLHARIKKDTGLKPLVARRIARQLLVGLSALHRAGIFHGDLRPANILLTSQEADADAWIADAATGGLRYWSRDIQSENACRYSRPPRDGHRPAEPTEADDLYALGLTLAEMLGGWDANPKHDADPAQQDASPEDGEPPTIQSEVGKRLKHIGSRDPVLRKVIERLLDESQPITAAEAVELLDAEERRTLQRQRLVGWGVAVVAAVVGVCLLLDLSSSRSKFQVATAEVKQLQADKKQLEDDRADHAQEVEKRKADHKATVEKLEAAIQRMRAEIDERTREPANDPPAGPPQSPSDDSEQKAQRIWAQAIVTNRPFGEQLKAFEDAVRQAKDAKVKQHLSGWHKVLKKHYDQAEAYFQTESELYKRYAAAQREPWNSKRAMAVGSHLNDLDKAAKIWKGWSNGKLTFATLPLKAAAEPPAVAAILTRWHGRMAGTATYTLRLSDGAAPAGWGTARVGSIEAEEEFTIPPHVWKRPTAHPYPEGPGEVTIPFTWTPDTPITVTLEQDDPWGLLGFDDNLIKVTIDGPLALWRLHDQGVEQDYGKQGKARLKFEIKGCPGPPRTTRPPKPKSNKSIKSINSNQLGPAGSLLQ